MVDGAGSERWERGWKVEGLQCRRDGERERQTEIVVTREAREEKGRDEDETRKKLKAKAKHQQCSERRRAAPRLFVWAVIFSLGQASVFVTILELLRLEDPRMGGLLYTSSEPYYLLH